MQPTVVAVALLWGAASGLVLSRAARRLAGEAPDAAVAADGRRGWFGPVGDRYGRHEAWPAALAALVCGALAVATGPRPELGVWLLLVPPAMLLARVDLAVRRLPDVITLPAAPATAALLGAAALLPGHDGSWRGALLGGVALGAAYFVLLVVNPAGLGFGDVKLAPTLGMAMGWYGWPVLFAGTFAGFLLGAVTGLTLLATGRAGRRTPIPFGPFMLLGALGGVLLGAVGAGGGTGAV